MPEYHTVANIVRMETDEQTQILYLVFEVTDLSFRKEIFQNWKKDVPVLIINKQLVKINTE